MSFNYMQPFMTLGSGLNTLQAGGIGGWVELGRTTLGGSADSISVSSLDDKRYYMVLQNILHSGTAPDATRLGNSSVDTGTNYASSYSSNGGARTTFTSINRCIDYTPTVSSDESFSVSYIANLSSQAKQIIKHRVGRQASGAGTAPNRSENYNKWHNTSNPLDIFQTVNIDTGDYLSGSEVVVLGWDPTDVHTNNFWTQIASVNATGSSTNISSGTITAYKYLWVQCWLKNTTSHTSDMTFNNDTTTYAYRNSDNSAADSTSTSSADIEIYSATTTPIFCNMFIINNSANEKLVIGNTVNQNTAGAATAPNRREFVGKWDETASQITEIDIDSSSGNWDSTSILKVWGSN